MQKIVSFILVCLVCPAVLCAQSNDSGNSFSYAKKILHDRVYADHRTTFYAGCAYSKDKKIDWASCGLTPRKQPKRAARLEWEHVMPAWEFGHQLQCWQNGGRKACREQPEFRRMESDMHNLQPAVGELNGDRSNFRYGMVNGEPRAYGQNIDFEVDFQQRVAEPTTSIRGDVARTYFYMAQEYSVQLSNKQRKLFEAWNKQDPVSAAELARMCKIAALQGNQNTFIGSCNPSPLVATVPYKAQGMPH